VARESKAPRLSLCAIALNEQRLIGALLESVYGLADEIVLGLDTRSEDATEDIGHLYGAKIIPVVWQDDFSYARNLTLDAATGDWVLVLDADERLTPEGRAAVFDVLASASEVPAENAVTGLSFLIGQYTLGGRLVGVTPSSGRLFRNRPEIRYRGVVHEEPWWLPEPSRTQWGLVSGVLGVHHYGYDPELWQQRGKRERNLQLLEARVAADPEDQYAQAKLANQRATTEPFIPG
jgi:glycosyltransferase involved in cell wall biosynthesis